MLQSMHLIPRDVPLLKQSIENSLSMNIPMPYHERYLFFGSLSFGSEATFYLYSLSVTRPEVDTLFTLIKMNHCTLIEPITGQRCTFTSRRLWNLKRHQLSQHQAIAATPAESNLGAQQRARNARRHSSHHVNRDSLILALTDILAQYSATTAQDDRPRKTQRLHSLDTASGGLEKRFSSANKALEPLDAPSFSPDLASPSATLAPSSVTVALSGPDTAFSSLDVAPCGRDVTSFHPQSQREERIVEHSETSRTDSEVTARLPSCQDIQSESTDSTRKRKWSIGGYDRILFSRTAPPMPHYDIKMSSKIPDQPKGLEWRSAAAKKFFEDHHNHRLAEWGVKPTHKGTCVLVPEDWKNLDPMNLLDLFDLDNCPTAQTTRLRYQYGDHCTSYARALAWFSQWPRSGLELDNLMGSCHYQPMDASHTCHHSTCINHVTYEATHINHSRKTCCEMAKKLRREKREISEHCDKHDPPCLLQVSNTLFQTHRKITDRSMPRMSLTKPTAFNLTYFVWLDSLA